VVAAATAAEGGSLEPAAPRPLSVREQSDAAAGADLTGLEHLGETGLGWLKKFKSCEEETPAQAAMVRRCMLTVPKPVLKAPMAAAPEAIMW